MGKKDEKKAILPRVPSAAAAPPRKDGLSRKNDGSSVGSCYWAGMDPQPPPPDDPLSLLSSPVLDGGGGGGDVVDAAEEARRRRKKQRKRIESIVPESACEIKAFQSLLMKKASGCGGGRGFF